MKLEKTSDCVQMKAEIQESLLREIAEFGEAEAAKRWYDRLSRDPIVGPFARMATPGSVQGTVRKIGCSAICGERKAATFEDSER